MKIVFVSEFFPRSEAGELRGGAEARAFYITKHLALNHKVTVVSSREPGLPAESGLFDSRLAVLRCGPERGFTQAGSLKARLWFLRSASTLLKSLPADIFDAQNLIAYQPVWNARSAARRVVMTVHDVWRGRWVKLFGPSGVLGEWYEARILKKRWDLFVANSQTTRERLTAAGIDQQRIRVVYNGIEYERLSLLRVPKYPVPTVCFVGRLVEYKHVDDLIAAVDQLRPALSDIHLVITGVGPAEERLRADVVRRGLEKNVTFRGHVPSHQAVLDEVARSHALCLPSTVEGFGMVTVEAMALGTPFVNADIPVTQEVTNGEGGLFFPPGDIAALSAALRRVLTETALRERLGEAGRARAKAFGWQTIADQTQALYKRVLDQPRGAQR